VNPENGALPDKRWVGRSFGLAAERYDGLAGLQRTTALALLTRLFGRMAATEPGHILDVGAGTGYPTRYLLEHWPGAQVIALDLAEAMLRVAGQRLSRHVSLHRIVGDAESLPLADESIDLVFTNLALQWCNPPEVALKEFFRVLKPGGRLAFSTFGPATLQELRTAWATVDRYTHVSHFPGIEQYRHSLAQAGGVDCELLLTPRHLKYPAVMGLMEELKGLGAHNMTRDRPRHLLGKSTWQRMIRAYEAQQAGGDITATFEIMTGHCIKGVE
jgi:malonyl-CoA O-methyltransferase